MESQEHDVFTGGVQLKHFSTSVDAKERCWSQPDACRLRALCEEH